MSPSRILPLPTAGSKDFTAKKGAGDVHNLYHALHQASVSSQSTLHVLRPHIDAITKIFDTSSVKQAIRTGGLSSGQQQTVLKKILRSDPKLHGNTEVKHALKQVVEHFNKEQSDLKKKMLLRRRLDQNREGLSPIAPTGVGSINQIVHPADDPNKMIAGSISRPTIVGSVGDLRKGPVRPPSSSRPPGSGAFRPTLVK